MISKTCIPAVLIIVTIGAWASPATAGVAEFDAYVGANLCPDEKTTDCLEELDFRACHSGCVRTGYNWRSTTPGRLEIHLTLNSYLKHLRNAALAAPTTSTEYTLGLTFEDLLWHQLQMYFIATHADGSAQARYYDEDFRRLPISAVKDGNIVDPQKFYAVTWVNEGGLPSAMTQADLGLWLLTVARGWAEVGQPSRADYYLRLSERVFRPYGVPVKRGGVRNNKSNYRCFGDKFCYWFHSQEVMTDATVQTILNKHLHAVRDSLIAHELLASWRDEGCNGYSLPAEFNTSHIEQLKEWGRGGLFQLAYAAGNTVDPSAPPNLGEFLMDDPSVKPFQYAGYHYVFGEGPYPITPEKTCHYHYHSAALLASILMLINPEPTNVLPGQSLGSPYFSNDPDFVGVYYKLLYGRPEGDHRTCNNRSYIPNSRRKMGAEPMAKIYRASNEKLGDESFQSACQTCQPCKFQCGFGEYADAKAFFDLAYEDCLF